MERPDEPKFFSVPEVSKMLGLGTTKTYSFLQSTECPFRVIQIGKRIVVLANSFYKWYENFAVRQELEEGYQKE